MGLLFGGLGCGMFWGRCIDIVYRCWDVILRGMVGSCVVVG